MQFGAKLVGKSPINQGWWEKSQLINHIETLHSVTTTSCKRAILLLFFGGNLKGLFFLKMKYLPRTVGISSTFLLVSLDLERG